VAAYSGAIKENRSFVMSISAVSSPASQGYPSLQTQGPQKPDAANDGDKDDATVKADAGPGKGLVVDKSA
jgi:hypothetical protein